MERESTNSRGEILFTEKNRQDVFKAEIDKCK